MAKDIYLSMSSDEQKFARMSGLKKSLFDILVQKVMQQIEAHQRAHPISARGKKSEMSIENKLLVMLMYYRNYHTYLTLSELFGISEGYANKLFYRMSKLVVKALPLGRKRVCGEAIKAVLIDASEQRIERPQKKQRQYYSGKKKSHHQNAISGG